MAIIKKFASYQNLTNFQTFLIDDNPLSDYFRITEFKDTFTGGKNGFLIEGSEFLKETTEIKVEVLDVNGNPVYYEPGDGNPEYYEGLSKLVAVHVYDDTPIGLGKITILGELKEYVDGNGVTRPVPKEWQGVYNVKWERTFKINKNLPNEDIVRFYKRPIISIEEIVKPIFNKTIPTKTISGSVSGVPQQPAEGTSLTNWRAGTFYKLVKSTGSWDVDIDENPITVSVDGNTYTPTIIEVLNEREVLVDVPYTSNNIVQSFTSQSFTASYQDIENEVVGDSPLTGSFAKIDMYQLKTFVGDVARVKIFRKSRNQVNDFQLVQESKLESTELLRDIYVSDAVEIPYGRFTDSSLSQYWITSSNDHPINVDSSVLSQAVKVDYDYNSGGVQKLITSESFSIAKDVEYTLSFRTQLSGSVDRTKYVKAYFSGSYTNNLGNPASYIQNFMHISGSDVYKTRQSVSQNILAERDIAAKLVFEFYGDDWYISNVSLRNAQETSFSPDEFTLIQDIPRKLDVETFDFRFEFYDINNNYIPVDVTATKEFDGGNDYVIGGTSARILTFESDRNAFRYASGSASPSNQTILLQHTKTNLTGSIVYTSGAFDLGGNLLTSSGWEQYPGFLTNRTDSTSGGSATLTVENFSGSWTGSGTQPEVYSIVYTASVEDLVEYETVFRVEDGDNAPQLLVTSNANQFIYEPTTLSPKPSGQNIKVRAQRKNLESLNSTITITSSSNAPLALVSDTGGVATYSISATDFSSSFASNSFDEVTYNFSSNDVLGNPQTDQITLSKVINFDAVSFKLSNSNHTFTADSTGVITSDFTTGNGSVTMFVAGNQIQFNDTPTKNQFEITNLQGTNCTPIGGNGFDPTTNEYGITAMSADSASLDVTITYIAGDSSTTQSFTETVTYTKAKKAQPSITFTATPQAQTVDAFSNGTVTGTTQDVQILGFEGNSSLTYTTSNPPGLGQYHITGISGVTYSNLTLPVISNVDFSTSDDTNTGVVSIIYKDSEGTSGTASIKFTLSKAKKAVPTVLTKTSPTTQTINSSSLGYEIPQPVEVIVQEGGVEYTYQDPLTSDSRFKINHLGFTAGSASFQNEIITLYTGSGTFNGLVGSASIDYIDSEGNSYSDKLVRFDLAVSKIGKDGINGSSGSDAQTVALLANQYVVKYDGDGTKTPVAITLTANAQNFDIPEYKFTENTILRRDWSTTATYAIPDSQEPAIGVVDIWEVQVRESGSAYEGVYDNTDIFGIQDGTNAITAFLTNEAHTLPTTNAGVVTYTDSGTSVIVYKGATELNSVLPTTTPTLGQFNVVASVQSGTIDTGSLDVTGNPAVFADHSGMTTDSAVIKYTLNVENTVTLVKYQSLAKSKEGDKGDPGSNAVSIELNPPSQEVILNVDGTYSNPTNFNVQVFDSSGTFPYSATLAATPSYKVGTVTNGSNSGGTITPSTVSNPTGSVVSVPIQYKDRDGNTSSVITKNHSIRVVTNGSTGPGIVFTGVWDTDRIYQYDLVGGRRDVVLWSRDGNTPYDTYYATLQQAGTTINPPDATTGSYWEELGQQDFFVAAKIAIFEESYVQNTLNIGTNSSSSLSAANITLWGADDYPYFSLGQSATSGTQEYGADGIFIGRHDSNKNNDATNGEYVMSISNGTNWLKWNGSTLEIKGDITVTNTGDFAPTDAEPNDPNQDNPTQYNFGPAGGPGFDLADVAPGTTPGLYLGASNLGYHNGTAWSSYLSSSGDFYLGGTGGALFFESNGGNLTVTGEINATSGHFTGNITSDATIAGGVISGSEVIGGVLSGATGDFSGSINAGSGEIGGWGIVSNQIYSPATGTRVMELTAGSTPALSIISESVVVVDINSQNTLTDLGAGAGVSGTASTTNYGTDSSFISFNSYGTINFNPNVSDAVYYDANSYQTITINAGDEGTYTVSATVSNANTPSSRLAYVSLSGGTTGVETGTFNGGVYMGWMICTQTLNPYNFIFDSQYSQQSFFENIQMSGGSWSKNLMTNRSATVSKSVNFANAGTYYVYPICWKFYGNITMSYSGVGYSLSYQMHSPKYTGLSASINIFKSELNSGGIQVVSSNTNYVKMERQPGISSTSTVMLEVGGSIEATGNITANASDERLKDVKHNIENPLDKIKNLNGIIFNWNQLAKELGGYDTDIENVGLLAQEVQKVLPQAVTTAPIDDGKGQNYLTIWYDKIVALLIEGMKELNNRVEKLEEENKRLNNGNS